MTPYPVLAKVSSLPDRCSACFFNTVEIVQSVSLLLFRFGFLALRCLLLIITWTLCFVGKVAVDFFFLQVVRIVLISAVAWLKHGTWLTNGSSEHSCFPLYKTVQRTANAFPAFIEHMGINHGRLHILMPQKLLDRTNSVA